MEGTAGNLLKERGLWLAIAESCTGGLVCHMITDVPGSSLYFKGAVIAYSNDVKRDLLGVSPLTLERYSPVSEETAREMAAGVRKRIGADIGLSITGIAGPDGGTDINPVGTVYIGVCNERDVESYGFRFSGKRRNIKDRGAKKALEVLMDFLLRNA